MFELLIQEAEALALPCYDLVPATDGEEVMAYWGGSREDLPEEFPEFVGAYKSRRHVLSVDSALWDSLGLRGRGPFALELRTKREDESEQATAVPVSSGSLASIHFKDSIPLKAVRTLSLPPIDAVILYGGPVIDRWLAGLGLQRWQYSDLTASAVSNEDVELYEVHFEERCPLRTNNPPYARVGGWHQLWPDDDYYIPREMRLMLWTFQDAEPWYEVFLTPMRNYLEKMRIT